MFRQLKNAEKKMTELVKHSQTLETENGTLKTQNQKLQAEVKGLVKEKEDLTKVLSNLRTDHKLLVNELATSKEELEKVRAELNTRTNERDNLQEKLDKLLSRKAKLRFAVISLLDNSSVLQELKLDKLDKVQTGKLQATLALLRRDMPNDRSRGFFLKPLPENSLEALRGVLSEIQELRLCQIQIQQAGVSALEYDDVQKALQLTDEQKKVIKEINGELSKDVAALIRGGDHSKPASPELSTKIRDLQVKALEKIVQKCLTDEQKKTFKDLTGEPFEIKFSASPRQSFGKP